MKTFEDLRDHIIGQSEFKTPPEYITKIITSKELKTKSFHKFFDCLYGEENRAFPPLIKSVDKYLMQNDSEDLRTTFIDFYVNQYFQPDQSFFCPFFPVGENQYLKLFPEIITTICTRSSENADDDNNNIQNPLDKKIDKNDNTLLHSASYCGNIDLVNLLICKGANVNAENKTKQTPLHYASANGHLPVVEFLVSNGANVNAKNEHQQTSLHYASANGHLSVVKLLLSQGANINAEDMDGNTPYEYAIKYQHLEVAEFLQQQTSIQTNVYNK